jgi:hypothetical protein
MKRCPITYEIISNSEQYSKRGLRLLSPALKNLLPAINCHRATQRSYRSRRQNVCTRCAYDLLNSSIAIGKSAVEMALLLKGKKNNIGKNILLVYFGKERLGLNDKLIKSLVEDIRVQLPEWRQLIQHSFLSAEMKKLYLELMENRANTVFN